MKLDPARSRVSVFTFAEGLFSALAHDLELVARDLEGELTGERVTVRAPVASVQVVGVVKRGRTDTGVLSTHDRAAIEKQIREDVLPGEAVTATGDLEGSRARIEVRAPRGTASASCPVQIERGGEARARGEVELSIKALGSPPVKGPMGAFRVSDRVKVTFDLVFA